MDFKTIAAILQTEQDAGRVLDCVVPLASVSQSHVVGIHAEAVPVPYTSATGFPDTEFLQVSSELNKERSDKLKALFTQRTQSAGLGSTWQGLESFSGDSGLSGLASVRASDLVIAAQREQGDGSADIGALVYDAGRPVLVVPSDGPIVTSFKRILLIWNGSREAARATFDALPFIVKAEQTTLLIIDPPETFDESSDQAGADIAASLARHGANVSVSVQKSNGDSVEDIIHSRMDASGADLIVLGAYSQSWLRRLFFGGVTNSVLRSGKAAAFLSR
jgi:nucleotide-binding universal stress UspA family protein